MVQEKIILWTNDFDNIETIADDYVSEGYEKDTALDMANESVIDDLNALRKEAETIKTDKIICYGRIGRWNGPAFGYRIFDSLKDIFYTELDTVEWYIDGKGDLRADGSHHDGSNSYLYREINCTDEELSDIEEKIYCSGSDETAVINLLEKYTKPLGSVFQL